jgi:hypothetical protein
MRAMHAVPRPPRTIRLEVHRLPDSQTAHNLLASEPSVDRSRATSSTTAVESSLAPVALTACSGDPLRRDRLRRHAVLRRGPGPQALANSARGSIRPAPRRFAPATPPDTWLPLARPRFHQLQSPHPRPITIRPPPLRPVRRSTTASRNNRCTG